MAPSEPRPRANVHEAREGKYIMANPIPFAKPDAVNTRPFEAAAEVVALAHTKRRSEYGRAPQRGRLMMGECSTSGPPSTERRSWDQFAAFEIWTECS